MRNDLQRKKRLNPYKTLTNIYIPIELGIHTSKCSMIVFSSFKYLHYTYFRFNSGFKMAAILNRKWRVIDLFTGNISCDISIHMVIYALSRFPSLVLILVVSVIMFLHFLYIFNANVIFDLDLDPGSILFLRK